MILPDLRLLLLLLLLTGGTRAAAPSTPPDRPAHHRPSEPPPPADGTSPDPESRPNRTDRRSTDSASHPPSSPAGIYHPVHPNRTDSVLTGTESPSQPISTGHPSLSQANRTDTDQLPGSEKPRTRFPPSLSGTNTDTPNRTDTEYPEEPEILSEPNGTDTEYPEKPETPSEPNGTGGGSSFSSHPNGSDPRARWRAHKAGNFYLADEAERELPGRRQDFRWDAGGTEPNFARTDGQTSPDSVITQKSVTRRHISKRTPNMDVSTTGEQISATDNTDLSDLTQRPTAATNDADSASTNTGTEEARTFPGDSGNQTVHSGGITRGFATRAKDLGNPTHGFTTRAKDLGNPTHGFTTREKDLGNPTHVFSTRAKDLGNTTFGSTTGVKDSGNPTNSSTTRAKDLGNPTYNSTSGEKDSGNTTYSSTTGDKDSGNTTRGFVTEVKDSGNTTHGSVIGVKDSGNPTHGFDTEVKDSGSTTLGLVTVMEVSENVTETSGLNKTDSELPASITYPLETPSYLSTTYRSPTSNQVPESSAPFTSIPVTAPNTTSRVPGTDAPASESSFAPNSSLFTFPASTSSPSEEARTAFNRSSSSESPSTPSEESQPAFNRSSSSESPSTPSEDARTPFNWSSSSESSSPEEARTAFNRSSSDVSSPSLIPSTSVPFSTFSSDPSPELTSTKASFQQTTLRTTPEPPSSSYSPSERSPSHTTSSSDDKIESSTSYRTSLATSRADPTSEAFSSSTPVLGDASTTAGDGRRFLDRTTTALNDSVTTRRSVLDSRTPPTSPADGGAQSVATHVTEPPARPTSPGSLTTSVNLVIPSSRFSTQRPRQDTPVTTRPEDPTTADPSKQATTIRTTEMDTKTVVPKVETTTMSKERKVPAHTTTQPGAVTGKYSTTTTTTSPPSPAAPPTPSSPAPVNVCSPNPCRNSGSCVQIGGRQKSYRCECPASWQGELCDSDVDECLSSPCPAPSTCVNLRGSSACRCPLGYVMEKGSGCVQVRTFLGHIEIPRSFLNGSNGKFTKLQQIEEEILHILNSSFSAIAGFYQSAVTNSSFSNRIELSVQNLFLLSSNVTLSDLRHHIQRYKKGCQAAPQPSPACQLILHSQLYYRAVSLCNLRNLGCDNETSECADPAGIAQCQCKAGYFKYSVMDRSCRACDDGYRLLEGACVRCPFGLGGFNCSNPYQLITVIISAAGGGLLLILGIALAATCCRKSRHDISKLIFKSGDFQMSPYAEYPKAQRSSEWGRETIEMQENGSTKNLLQMTDVYYSPGLRTSEMERNGLYPPYSGLPGSRHSCIYPGQYNPTFINEENRRRDYF